MGAVALDLQPAEDGHERLRRAGYQVDTCLVFLGNGLDGRDVDILSRACQAEGIRVLAPDTDRISTDYDEVRQHTLDYVRREMLKLETALLRRDPLVPTIVDGLLDRRIGRVHLAQRAGGGRGQTPAAHLPALRAACSSSTACATANARRRSC